MGLENINLFEGILLWYASGVVTLFLYFLWRNFHKKDEIVITIEDLVNNGLFAIGGPILWLLPVFKFFIDLAENYGKVKSKVVWKNRRAKNKDILFGDSNDDDTPQTYPKF